MSIAIQREPLVWLFVGPLFLLASIPFVFFSHQYDLLGIALIGFVASFLYARTGVLYASIGLLFFLVYKLLFSPSLSLGWCSGLSASFVCSWVITALVSEENQSFLTSLQTQLTHRMQTIQHLEEGLTKVQEESATRLSLAVEKSDELQIQWNALQEEHASIVALNELLRDASLQALKEREQWARMLQERELALEQLQVEKETLQKELERALNGPLWHDQNRQLLEELNSARTSEEQTRLMNDTLARLYANEKKRCLETTPSIDRQLRQQFEEQKERLHQARAELFHVDTRRQQLEREKEEIVYEAQEEALRQERELILTELIQENQELQTLVSFLTIVSAPHDPIQ